MYASSSFERRNWSTWCRSDDPHSCWRSVPRVTPRIAVVTDSTAYLPSAQARAADVTIVPVQVVIGGQSMAETDVSSADVATALKDWTPVSTSRPSPATFINAYTRAEHEGATGIVSVHLSGAMSATVESAELASKEVSIPGPCR